MAVLRTLLGQALRTIPGTRCLILAAPTCCMATRSSILSSSSTFSTPDWPKAPRPQMYGRPMHTARAPIASALTMSRLFPGLATFTHLG